MAEMDSSTERKIRAGQTFKILIWVVIAAALAVFALVNTQEVTVDWLVGDGTSALWIVIAACAGLGFVAGWLTHARRD